MRGTALRRPQRQTLQSVFVPAPLGGVNTIDPMAELPPGDCLLAYNVTAGEGGLRVRQGSGEWVTGLTGATDNLVRTKIPFTGSTPGSNKLFGASSSGIWDLSASTVSPSLSIAFPVTTGDAGWGVSAALTTPAGRFVAYCDEVNGLYLYSELAGTWSKVASGTRELWAPNTVYAIGNHVANGGKVYVVTGVTGDATSAASGGPTGTSTGITDHNVTWNYVSPENTSAIGPSLADQNLGYDADPASFVHIASWGQRPWFAERGTSRAWYLDVNSLFGVATSFDFGSRMRSGGSLRGLWNWSYDGGSGMATKLVGLSDAGDVVIYGGTDPSSPDTFGIVGSWSVGGLVAGRTIATEFGGDMLVLSAQGAIPLSKLVIGNSVLDRSQYATAKISNLFNLLAQSYGSQRGWAVALDPLDHVLLIVLPIAAGNLQLAMSLAKGGWSVYRDLPIVSCATWDGVLYFGTSDGRSFQKSGYTDNRLLSDASSFSPINYSLLSAYQNSENAKQKRVHWVRPSVQSGEVSPVIECTPKYGYDINEPAPPAGASGDLSGTWDHAVWDKDVWAGDHNASQPFQGGGGMGREVAIAVRGSAVSRTILLGFDVFFDVGWEL